MITSLTAIALIGAFGFVSGTLDGALSTIGRPR
jgi:hypothetical protein